MGAINLATEAFNSKQAVSVTGITKKQLVYWDEKGIVKPSIRPAHGKGSRRLYSYLDLLALATVKSLKEEGLSLQRIGKCISFLRKHRPDVSQPLTFFQLVTCGETVLIAANEKAYLDVLRTPGQLAHRSIIDVAMLEGQLRDSVIKLTGSRVEEVSVGDYTYQVQVEPDEEAGGYVGTVAGLPGCITDGDTLTEVIDNARDAIECWLEAQRDLEREGIHVPVSGQTRRRHRTA